MNKRDRKRARTDHIPRSHQSSQAKGVPLLEPGLAPGTQFGSQPELRFEPTLLPEPEPGPEPAAPAEPAEFGQHNVSPIMLMPSCPTVVIPEAEQNLGPEPDPKPEPSPGIEIDLCDISNNFLLSDDDKELDVDPAVPYDVDININIQEATQPIFRGASITLHQSFVSLLTLVLSFKLTGVCLKAILSLISLHLPKENYFKTSVNYFKKYFAHLQVKKDYLYFCSICFKKCEKSGCPNHVSAKICYLVKLPLIPQLQMLFNREGFYEKLKFTSNSNNGILSDIYDGEVYKNAQRDGSVGKEGSISFNWYTDGMALYKSSNTSVWPFYLTVNELPYKDRFKKENILLPVLWVGPVKPPANIIIDEIYPDLKLIAAGVKFNIPNIGEKVIKGQVISGSGDTPARSMMMSIVQFNGATSCQRCEQPGEPRVDNPGVGIFPYKLEEMTPRTVANVIEYAAKAKPKKPFMGVKRTPGLNLIMPDFIHGVSIDPMHGLYGGCCKKILRLLTDPSKEKYSVSKQKVENISERLLSIRPPAHTTRVPRSLSELAYWKMKELKSFCHDYSLPVLQNLIPSMYLKHHATFVAGVQLLSSDVVSHQSLEMARELLHKYVSLIPDLYNPKVLTMNFHLLLHLDEVVRDLGPLWVYTCFPMEDINGVILSLVHGTRWAERLIGDSVQTCLAMPELVRNLEECESKKFCRNILERGKCATNEEVGKSKIIGKSDQITQVPTSLQHIEDISQKKIQEIGSIKKGMFIYTSMAKQKPDARRDSTAAAFVFENSESIGLIKNFFRVFYCNCPFNCSCESKIFVVIQKLQELSKFSTLIENVFVPNISEYIPSHEIIVINAEHLSATCTRIEINEKLFVSKPCNSREIE